MSRLLAATACALIGFTGELAGQCRWSDEKEGYSTIRSSTIKREVISFIDWVWEYEGTGTKPAMLHLKGKSDCESWASFNGHGVDVRITSAPFDSTKHKLIFETNGYPTLCEIDDRPFRGTDGAVPRVAIKRVTVTIDSMRVQLPTSAWNDLYQPHFCGQHSTKASIGPAMLCDHWIGGVCTST